MREKNLQRRKGRLSFFKALAGNLLGLYKCGVKWYSRNSGRERCDIEDKIRDGNEAMTSRECAYHMTLPF